LHNVEVKMSAEQTMAPLDVDDFGDMSPDADPAGAMMKDSARPMAEECKCPCKAADMPQDGPDLDPAGRCGPRPADAPSEAAGASEGQGAVAG
jgi:hypothetical protein